MSGFGSGFWGTDPWSGSGIDPLAAFDLLQAVPPDYRTVDLEFSHELLDTPALVSPAQYSINNGLAVIAVIQTNFNTVRLFTLNQNLGTVYTVTVGPLVLDSNGNSLSINQASFVGLGIPDKFLVADLDARSVCTGEATFLRWTNPAGTQRVKIVRRLRAYPFDLTDLHDVVYEGDSITSFFDTGVATPLTTLFASVAVGATSFTVADATGYVIGDFLRVELLTGELDYDVVKITNIVGNVITAETALTYAYPAGSRVSRAIDLLPQTYYYYLVLVSPDLSPTNWDIDDGSRAFALSIAKMDSKDWLWRKANTPKYKRELDAMPVEEGGGAGFLDKWFGVMGCWLSLMRGNMKALALLNDPDKSPIHVLPSQNISLGIEPEGLAYDFDILRRPLGSLVYVYKRKGTCPGIIETVRMFTKWDALCIEFGLNQCQNGASSLRFWDGASIIDYGTGPEGVQITQVVVDAEGTAVFTDTAKTWDLGLFGNSTLRGWIGDIVCVRDNPSETELTIEPPRKVTEIIDATLAGETSFEVLSTVGLRPGLNIQITSNVEIAGEFAAEVFEINTVTPGVPGTITVKTAARKAFGAGSKLSIAKSIVRAEYVGSGTAASQVIADPVGGFVENQWKGYLLLDSANVLHEVLSNTGDEITVDGAAPVTGAYAVAYDFTLGATFADRVPILKYKLGNGVHSTTFEPTYDIETRGTLYDPYNRTYGGAGAPLQGVFGPNDVGIHILTPVTVIQGMATVAAGPVFELDTTQPAPGIDELVGMYLNPNQNQEQFFEILSNTATELLVAGDVSSLVVDGQAYYVLKPRDRIRFQRVTKRLREEFMDGDSRPHLLFV